MAWSLGLAKAAHRKNEQLGARRTGEIHSEIRMIPKTDQNGGLYYIAEGGWNLFGAADYALVAGVGFEPTTFGL